MLPPLFVVLSQEQPLEVCYLYILYTLFFRHTSARLREPPAQFYFRVRDFFSQLQGLFRGELTCSILSFSYSLSVTVAHYSPCQSFFVFVCSITMFPVITCEHFLVKAFLELFYFHGKENIFLTVYFSSICAEVLYALIISQRARVV